MEEIEYSETSAYKIQTPGNYPEESIQQFRGTSRINLRNKSMFLHPKGEDVVYCEKCVMCHQNNYRRFNEDIKILLKSY